MLPPLKSCFISGYEKRLWFLSATNTVYPYYGRLSLQNVLNVSFHDRSVVSCASRQDLTRGLARSVHSNDMLLHFVANTSDTQYLLPST